jgi:glycosyltransferase involved in cell wall biosynthesis
MKKKPAVAFAPFAPVAGLAVIVPALNEQGGLAACLDSIAAAARRLPWPPEVVVADGGSTDATVAVAVGRAATIVNSQRGRGAQIRAGIEASGADTLLVLHADCRLEPDALAAIVAALGARPLAAGGALGLRFEPDFFLSGLAGRLNSLKTRLTGVAFGDQGQFFRRDALSRIGGFPDLALMEDVELSLRLREAGEIVFIGRGVIASSRAWKQYGFFGNFRRMLPLLFTYLVRRRLGLSIDAAAYYRKYYRGAAPDPARGSALDPARGSAPGPRRGD